MRLPPHRDSYGRPPGVADSPEPPPERRAEPIPPPAWRREGCELVSVRTGQRVNVCGVAQQLQSR